MRSCLDDAENRCTKLELTRRSMEGEMQRLKLAMNDKETENQVNTATDWSISYFYFVNYSKFILGCKCAKKFDELKRLIVLFFNII